ncbi:MAG: hypothetical protein RL329_2295 [Bacteroidota bacterium]|jgi:hypothetical protein
MIDNQCIRIESRSARLQPRRPFGSVISIELLSTLTKVR